jgi:hypothetical protein
MATPETATTSNPAQEEYTLFTPGEGRKEKEGTMFMVIFIYIFEYQYVSVSILLVKSYYPCRSVAYPGGMHSRLQ